MAANPTELRDRGQATTSDANRVAVLTFGTGCAVLASLVAVGHALAHDSGPADWAVAALLVLATVAGVALNVGARRRLWAGAKLAGRDRSGEAPRDGPQWQRHGAG